MRVVGDGVAKRQSAVRGQFGEETVREGLDALVLIFFMLRITSDKAIMGAHTNGRWFNAIAWGGAIVTASISILMVIMTVIQ